MAGYSGTPLIKKLGLKPGQRASFINAPQGYETTLGELPFGVKIASRLGKPHSMDFIHFFTLKKAQLEKEFPKLKEALGYDGILWISWPKKSARIVSDIDENIVRQIGLDIGLVDVKVAAVDETWSALKFVYRVKDRPAK